MFSLINFYCKKEKAFCVALVCLYIEKRPCYINHYENRKMRETSTKIRDRLTEERRIRRHKAKAQDKGKEK